jgi:DNA-binding transcriptional LysR family regulator
MDFQLRLLNQFLAIVDQQSFSRAAAKLGIPQPSLSQRIQTLERQLGFPLIIRSPLGIRLTPEAETLLESFRELVERGKRIGRLAQDVKEGKTPALQIGVTMHSDRPARADLINDFGDAYPKSHIELEMGYTLELYHALLTGRYDLGFSAGPPPEEDLDYLIVQRFRAELLVRHDSPLAASPVLSIADLRGLRIVTTRAVALPTLYDSAIRPLEEAGASLVFPADETQMGLVAYALSNALPVAMPIPFLSNDVLVESGFIRKQIVDLDVPVALMLLRPRRELSQSGQSFWNFTRAWLASPSSTTMPGTEPEQGRHDA